MGFVSRETDAHTQPAAVRPLGILTLVPPSEPPTLEMRCRDERHSRKKSKTSNHGHRPFRGTCRGNRPRNGDRGGNQLPCRCSRLADGRRGHRKEKAHAAMQEALKNLEAAKDAASPEKIAEIDTKIAIFSKNYDTNLARAAIYKESLPTMQADIDAAQSECDKAHNRTRDLEAELNKIPHTDYETRYQLELAIMDAQEQESRCEDNLEHCRMRLESQKSLIYFLESEVEFNKTHLDGETAKRDALLDNLKKAQAAYDDACKAYEEAKAAADKAASPEITQPTETTPPSNSAQPAEAAQPASSPATGKDAASSSTKQANTSNSKQATTTADKLANTGDTTPSAIALAGIAVAGLGITATATRRLKNSK